MYLQSAKIGIVLVIIGLYSATVWRVSASVERESWLIKEIEAKKEVERLNQWAQQKTEENVKLSQQKESELYDKNITIDELNTQLRNSLAAKRVPVRAACNQNRVSKTSDPVVSTAQTAGDEFTTEFREFLLSSLKRGDEAGVYAEIAHEWAVGQCKNSGVICQ